MADSDGQKLQDCLTSLSDGLRMEITRTTNLESTLTTQQSRVTELEQHFADQVQTLSTAHELKFQHLDNAIQQLDTQIKESFLHPVYILPQLQHFCILGLDFLRKYNLYVGGNNDQILFPPESSVSSISTPPTPPPYHDDPILHHPSIQPLMLLFSC
ncbi:unnamed protein product, partial [Rotaria magnacalcarata]